MSNLSCGPAAGQTVTIRARLAAAGLRRAGEPARPGAPVAAADRGGAGAPDSARVAAARSRAAERIGRQRPQMLPPIRVLIADDQRVVRDGLAMLDALIDGAHGYLTKDASAEQTETAIRAACAGQTHLHPLVQERLVAAVTGPPPEQAATGACPLPAGLTASEAEVLTLLAAGLSNAGIAPAPVRQQRHREDPHQPDLRQDRAQAVRYAYRTGLASPSA